MIIANKQPASLIQYNRNNSNSAFDDEDKQTTTIRVVPYSVDMAIQFGAYSVPEATGYFQVSRFANVEEGDQIIFTGKFGNQNIELTRETLTVQKVQDVWLYNRIEYKWVAVK